MIIGIQISTLIFSFVMIYFAILHYKRREIDRVEMSVWFLVWAFAIVAIVFPDPLQSFAREFRFARLFDLMVVGGLILVIVMVTKAYVSIKRIEKKVERMVRNETLKNVKKGK